MRELSLFTGAGGGLLGSMLLGWDTVAAVEYEPYCQRVLCARGGVMADAEQGDSGRRPVEQEWEPERGATPDGASTTRFPVFNDVRTFDATAYRGRVDIVTGGFPCQPHSQAGKRLGGLDSRDLWPDTVRILRESGAPLGFFENVPGLLTSLDADGLPYFGRVLGDLSEAGFDAEWLVLGADDVGAPHRRKRLWILAYRPGAGPAHVPEVQAGREQSGRDAVDCGCRGVAVSPWHIDPADVADGDGAGLQERCRAQSIRSEHETAQCRSQDFECGDGWLAEPYVGRVAHGVASRVDRLRALGNGQVPQCMALAFQVLARRAGVA